MTSAPASTQQAAPAGLTPEAKEALGGAVLSIVQFPASRLVFKFRAG